MHDGVRRLRVKIHERFDAADFFQAEKTGVKEKVIFKIDTGDKRRIGEEVSAEKFCPCENRKPDLFRQLGMDDAVLYDVCRMFSAWFRNAPLIRFCFCIITECKIRP